MKRSSQFLLLFVVFAPCLVNAAEEENAKDERLTFMKASAGEYRVTEAKDESRELKIIADPILRWTNPVSGLKDGTLFMWTNEAGRPAAAAQVFLTADDLWIHEFQSLYESPFEAKRDEAAVWQPSRAGVTYAKLPDAPVPASTAVKRLSQMRTMAERFTANDEFEGKSRWELRMLARPLLRYSDEKADLLDGAVFTLAHGTDPEVFILLEARKVDGQYVWHYALAPMTGYALKVQLDGKEIWEIGWRKGPYKATEPFFITVDRRAAKSK